MKKINGRGKKASKLQKQKVKGAIQEVTGVSSRLEKKAEHVKNDLAAKVPSPSP